MSKCIMKKDTTQILSKLRQIMQQPPPPSDGHLGSIAAYIVPSDDEHQSEYISKSDERREYVTGFNGSAGTAVVTAEKALLWTDGRYYQQAQTQLDHNWNLMKDGLPATPTIGGWLAQNLSKGTTVGVDPKLLSCSRWRTIQKDLSDNDVTLIPVEKNLVDLVWGDARPARTSNKIFSLDLTFTGLDVCTKWDKVKEQMESKKADALVVSALDEIAWFLNLRGTDIDYNPLFFAYLIITLEKLKLFTDSAKLPANFREYQLDNKVEVTVHPYEEIGTHLAKMESTVAGKVWIAMSSSYYLTSLISKQKRHQEITPIAVMKAVKNATEVEGFINCHVRDGVALCKYFAWLQGCVQRKEYVDEITGAAQLEKIRSKGENFAGLSFPTISASGPNGSVIHYVPTEDTKRPINDKGIYLCDSGAQYLDGTTDVTRSMHFGQPTDFEMETYTRVMKGQLQLGSTIFPRKVKGQVLDTLARKALWDVGLDYGHGTGHGVGHYLNVHEGPMGIGFRMMPDDPGLQEDMFLSNEPGYYHDGDFGIRIEDIVQIVPANAVHDFAGRGALTFKTVTMCPKQTKMLKKELLTETEIKLLNDYHELVWQQLSPILKEEGDKTTLEWLQKETQRI